MHVCNQLPPPPSVAPSWFENFLSTLLGRGKLQDAAPATRPRGGSRFFKRPPLLFTLHRTLPNDFPRIYPWIVRCLCLRIFENWRLFLYQRIYRERERRILKFDESIESNATRRASIIYTLRCNFYNGTAGGLYNLIDLYRYDFTLKNWLRCIRYVFNIPQYAIDECIIGLMFTSTCINITYINIASIYAVDCYPRNKL